MRLESGSPEKKHHFPIKKKPREMTISMENMLGQLGTTGPPENHVAT